MRTLHTSAALAPSTWLRTLGLTLASGALVMACAANTSDETGDSNSAISGSASAAADGQKAADAAEKARQAKAAEDKDRAEMASTMSLTLGAWAEADPSTLDDAGDCIDNGRAFQWTPGSTKAKGKALTAFLQAHKLDSVGVAQTPGAKSGTYDLRFIRGLACFYYDGLQQYEPNNEMIRCTGIPEADKRINVASCVAVTSWSK